jgi:Zn-dependent protease
MRDPLNWSFPLGRLFGIQVRVHFLFPILVIALIGRAAINTKLYPVPGQWIDVAVILGLLFFSVLLHELGHCFGARMVDGDASEILMWPLGGLAMCEVPHTPRANFITTICGPLVNLILFLGCAAALAVLEPGMRPWINPFEAPLRDYESGATIFYAWNGTPLDPAETRPVVLLLQRLFWVNWFLFLLNIVVAGFPLDGGRLVQSIVWRFTDYRQGTVVAVMVGFLAAIVVGVYGIIMEQVSGLALALFIYVSCRHQWIVLEMGDENSSLGYDFSQGYTSLERDQPAAPIARRRQSWFQRWRQRRAQQRMLREQETREAEERRLDELLEKVHRDGQAALTEEERRFLKRASDRYRNRQ